MKPGLPPETMTMNNQNNVGKRWQATNWIGVCDELAELAKPTLIITGTDDNLYYQISILLQSTSVIYSLI